MNASNILRVAPSPIDPHFQASGQAAQVNQASLSQAPASAGTQPSALKVAPISISRSPSMLGLHPMKPTQSSGNLQQIMRISKPVVGTPGVILKEHKFSPVKPVETSSLKAFWQIEVEVSIGLDRKDNCDVVERG
jgi:hypothetical protein